VPDKTSVQKDVCDGVSLDASSHAAEQVNWKPDTFVWDGGGIGAFDIGINI
jgi:hypothetical protein